MPYSSTFSISFLNLHAIEPNEKPAVLNPHHDSLGSSWDSPTERLDEAPRLDGVADG